ncbi:MAG: NifB/NifX family molybdenum-iron cluster-binding protein [Candidatus Marinimicrobia bacterium]|nr:NifB/NifX family molybdenum-iron cluster-binding protein [Candidatus Neomarinimicrobiota bacterium]
MKKLELPNEIKIAIPTSDGENIFPKMLGMAKEFHIYEAKNKQIKFLEKRKNPFEKTLQHLKTLDVYEIINDCNIIVSNKIGKKGIKRLEKKGVKLFFENGEILNTIKKITEKIC